MTWHYEQNGQRLSGATVDDMYSLIMQRKIDGNTLVWSEGFTDWTKLQETELATHLAAIKTPPPLPASKINNTVVWILAAAPIIGLFLEGFIAGLIGKNEFEVEMAINEHHYWYVTLILNIGLGILDERRLKAAGIDTGAFGKTVFIIPVYLWKRAKSLNQSPAYFWIWLGLFVLSLFA